MSQKFRPRPNKEGIGGKKKEQASKGIEIGKKKHIYCVSEMCPWY